MARRARVQLPDPTLDRPAAWSLWAIGLPALFAGLAAADWVARAAPDAAPSAPVAAASHAPAPVGARDAGLADVGGEPGAHLRAGAARAIQAREASEVTDADADADAEDGARAHVLLASPTDAPGTARDEEAAAPAPKRAPIAPPDAEGATQGPPATTSARDATDTSEVAGAQPALRAQGAENQDSTAGDVPDLRADGREGRAPAQPAGDDVAAAPVSFARGQVAYVRCDGVPQRRGRFPCPRDRALENYVWALLTEQLPQCAKGSGQFDVRLDFRRWHSPKVQVRADADDAGATLTADTVESCVRSGLRQSRTRLRPDRMIVSFRFGLVHEGRPVDGGR